VTKTAGDVIPWVEGHNLLLLSPAVICGIVVPSTWTPNTARRLAGLDPALLQHYRQQFHPVLAEVEQVARERATAARRQADAVLEDRVEEEDMEADGIVIVDSDSDWDYV